MNMEWLKMNDVKRITFFIGNMSSSGGTERVLSIIANGLAERGYQISIISLWGNGGSFFPIREDIPVYWIEELYPGKMAAKELLGIRAILRREQTQVLVDVDIILCFYSFILRCFSPRIYHISWEHFNFFYNFRRKHFLRKVSRILVGTFSQQLIVISDEDKTYYQENLRLRCNINRIYNPNPYEEEFVKEKEEKIIFAAGRLTGVKGFDLLIKSWKLLEEKYPDWQVVVAGEGEDRKILENMILVERLKKIHFIGNVSNIEKYYENAAFFVLPSRDEGFGMVILEAMDFAIPVVSFDCKAGPKEIITDGENGFLVEPENIEEFAHKMELLIKDENLRREMGKTAKRSTGRFAKDTILDEWEKLLGTIKLNK